MKWLGNLFWTNPERQLKNLQKEFAGRNTGHGDTEIRSWNADAHEQPDRIEDVSGIMPSDISELFRIGSIIDKYKIIAEIGHGAMGRVYKVVDVDSGDAYALKTIHSGGKHTDKKRSRLTREGLAQARLQHPNIIAIHETGTYENVPYIVMELIEGGTSLSTLIGKAGTAIEAQWAIRIIRDVAQAITYCHMQGIIHRDIKPSNILIKNDMPKLTDFGLAYVEKHESPLTRLTQSGETLGTVAYMPPEQARGLKPQPDWDVYSIGATLYELLTGQPPFKGATLADAVDSLMNKDPAQPASLGAAMPKGIEAICYKCLDKDPLKRYDGAAALVDDLNRYINDRPIKAPKINWPIRRVRRAMRGRRLVLVLSMMLFILLGTSLWSSQQLYYRSQLRQLMNDANASSNKYSVAFLSAALQDRDPIAQARAATKLCSREEAEAQTALQYFMINADGDIALDIAAELIRTEHPNMLRICENLTRSSDKKRLLAAIMLAQHLDIPVVLPWIEHLTEHPSLLVRNRALDTTFTILGADNHDFTDDYLENGPETGRQWLLEQMSRFTVPPPMPVLIDVMDDQTDKTQRAKIANILSLFSNGDFGTNPAAWQAWWKQHGSSWALRRLIGVESAPAQSCTRRNDAIWSIDGSPIASKLTVSQTPSQLKIVRQNELIDCTAATGDIRGRIVYMGMMSGKPAGKHPWVPRLRLALAGHESNQN